MYDAIWKMQQSYAGAQPAIVPPSYAKLHQRPWLSQTWGMAAAALGSAKTVIFIGYSLPRTDGALRALLVGSRILAASSARRQRVVVIDTSRRVRAEYRKLYHAIEPGIAMSFARGMQRVIPDVLKQAAGA
jgi:anaerobic selenocysteine-containing dehydrogenase